MSLPTNGVPVSGLPELESLQNSGDWIIIQNSNGVYRMPAEALPGQLANLDEAYSEETYTEFDSDVVSGGTVIVTKKFGWCCVRGTVVITDEVTDWTTILDNTKIPAPQFGTTIYQTVSSWSSTYVRPARVSILGTGGLNIRYGAAFELDFNIVYPFLAEA